MSWNGLPGVEYCAVADTDPRGREASDLTASIDQRREPVASGEDGRKALEMIMGVYVSALSDSRASFPVQERNRPLTRWVQGGAKKMPGPTLGPEMPP